MSRFLVTVLTVSALTFGLAACDEEEEIETGEGEVEIESEEGEIEIEND